MLTVLLLLLVLDVILHAAVIVRFGTGDSANMPFLIFAIIDAVLAVTVFLVWPYALWATFILSIIGLIGLTVTFNKPVRDKTLDRIIWVVDALVVVCSGYLLFVG